MNKIAWLAYAVNHACHKLLCLDLLHAERPMYGDANFYVNVQESKFRSFQKAKREIS